MEEPAREGLALELEGVEYNVYITRELNRATPPDQAYYTGPAAAGRDLYGVFLQACNRDRREADRRRFFKVTDNQGNEFLPSTLPRTTRSRTRTRAPARRVHPAGGPRRQLGPALRRCCCSSCR